MAVYSELIKNFEKIREYVRDFYIFGFHTRESFDAKSKRTYDNEKRRIESWLSDHVLVQKNYPHHGAVAFGHYGKALHSVMTYLGMTDIGFNQPKGMLYPTENPFAD